MTRRRKLLLLLLLSCAVWRTVPSAGQTLEQLIEQIGQRIDQHNQPQREGYDDFIR